MSQLADQVRSLRLPNSSSAAGGAGRLAWALCVLLAAFAGWSTYRQWKTSAVQKVVAEVENKVAVIETRSSETVAAVGEIAHESRGYIIAAHQILVSPQVSGRLLQFKIEEGIRVTQGDVLAEIESTEYRSDFARAQATLELSKQRLLELETGNRPEEIEQAKAEMAEYSAQLRQLEAEWKRSTSLVKSKTITEQDYELAESKFQAMQRRVEKLGFVLKLMQIGPREERIAVARAEVQQADADLAKAKYRLENCTIRAPVSGTILKKNAEQGNIVNPVAMNGSYSVCEMADLADLEVSLDIQERDIARIFPGQRCQVRADAFPKRTYTGIVSRLMPIADRAKGAIPVRVKLQVPAEEEGVYLKPEMAAVVSFLNAAEQQVLKPVVKKIEPTPPEVSEPLVAPTLPEELPPAPSIKLLDTTTRE